ncbi:MAG: hypothetical protein PXZ07_03830 [Candidatus Eremiobacteraeota bacterium]|nr:hypothetical protein [Candidatus Eremiobacteraeota bacterium]
MRTRVTLVDRSCSAPSRWGVLALAIALMLPEAAHAAQCSPAPSSAQVTPAVRTLVDGINARGLERFARTHRSEARNEWSGSPVLDWYFDTIESGSALATRPVGTRAFLTGLSRAGIDLSGRMWADPAESKYSTADATGLARHFCVPTTWGKLAATPRAFQRWREVHVPKLRYLLEIDGDLSILFVAGITSALPHIPKQYVQKLPFYSRGGVRCARIEGRTAKTALYLFWGKRDALASFRKTLDLQRWKSVRKEFHPTLIALSNVRYERAYDFSRRAPGGMFFGATAMPQEPHENGIAGSGFLQIGPRNAMFSVGEGVAGTLKPNCFPMKPKWIFCPRMDWITYALPSGKHRLSAVVPMIYIVVDPRTGAILFIGAT